MTHCNCTNPLCGDKDPAPEPLPPGAERKPLMTEKQPEALRPAFEEWMRKTGRTQHDPELWGCWLAAKADLTAELEALRTENKALHAANLDCILHFDTLKEDHDKSHAELEALRKDAERLDLLDRQGEAYGFEDLHEGNRWLIEGPFKSLRVAIDKAIALALPDAQPVQLQHVAVAEDGHLRWMTGRKFQNAELYCMRDGGRAPSKLYTAPQPAAVPEIVKLSDEELKGFVTLAVEKSWTVSDMARAIEGAIHAKQKGKP